MSPELGDGRGNRLDEKVAVSVALAFGLPLILLLFLFSGFFRWDAGSLAMGPGMEEDSQEFASLRSGAGDDRKSRLAALGLAEETEEKERGFFDPSMGGLGMNFLGGGRAGDDGVDPGMRAKLDQSESEIDRMIARIEDLEAMLSGQTGEEAPATGRRELEFLMSENDRLRDANLNLERESYELKEDFAGAKVLHSRLARDGQVREQELQLLVRNMRQELDGEKSTASRLTQELDEMRQQVNRNRQMGSDVKKLQNALDRENQKTGKLEEDLKKSQEELKALQIQVEMLTAESKGKSGEGSLNMGEANALLRAEIELLRQKLNEREKAGSNMLDDDLAKLQARYLDVMEENERLRASVGRGGIGKGAVRAEPIRKGSDGLPEEAKQPGDLWVGAVPLYQALKKADQQKTPYRERDADVESRKLGRLVTRLNFAKDEHAVENGERAKLERALSQLGKGEVYLLVVGYASVSGRYWHNESLSRRRAEAVTAKARAFLNGGSRVQSVYFGETNQFDPKREEENRIVEIWRVDS